MASQVFRRIQTINPTTNKVLKQFEFHTDQEIHKIIQQSHESFLNHRRTNFQERLTKIERL
jgi:succinate-semialdehyde dehydrogenase/glutarate-semialdehyde dehydrogenase